VQGKKLTTYQFTPRELRHNLLAFIKEKYNYEPELYLHFSPGFSLPVRVDIEQEDSDEYYDFFLALQQDLFSIQDKQQGDAFEIGDKLLQLYFGFDVEEYLFKSSLDHDCEIYNDEGSIFIVCENNPITYTSRAYVEEKIEKLRKKLTRFSFQKVDFYSFNTTYFSLTEFSYNRVSHAVNLSYTGDNIDDLSVCVRVLGEEKIEKICIEVSGFFDQKDISDEAKEISQSIYEYFKAYFLKIKSVRIRQMYQPLFHFINKVQYIPVRIEKFERLTMVENVIFSLRKNRYHLQEIAEMLNRSKKAIDNTLLRIRKKDEVYNLGLFLKR